MLLSALLLTLGKPSPAFEARLWRALPTTAGNVVVSPASVKTCLGLLVPAVGPPSQPALARTLGTKVADLPNVQKGIETAAKSLVQGGQTTIANAGFFRQAPQPGYVAAIRKGLNAEAMRLKGLEQVNGWVDAKTKGRIPKLFARLDPNTSAVLVNAITFDGDWATPFAPASTKKAPFRGAGTVDLMRHPKLDAWYGEGAGFRIVRLPYAGRRYELTVLLSTNGDPAALLRDEAWRRAVGGPRQVDVSLPRFTIRSRPPVETALKAMGLSPLFEAIDLTPALKGSKGDAIDQIVHETWIKVDEKGTEAAAATGIAMAKSAPLRREPVVFRADRPFAFVIRHVQSDEVLFEGVIRKP